ncbi:hypothetical protein LTR37_020229 [Vermiconidia calcicola]|uniref:Uncharacterized protein n=1 Tax=Vermiconidia calcicola TaxID=1690605 RepID=A0ACC3MDP0_9PEZI|nr:hypothetical protein LTR37_020229 [Vermiconidia calcicola]
MSSDKVIVLITGGNSGIGYSLAEQLLVDKTKHVIITSRSIEKGDAALKALQDLKQPGSVEVMQLQLTDPNSIAALANKVQEKHGRLDALVNNAAQAAFPEGTSTFEQMQTSFAANVTGPAVMIETFKPLLNKSTTTPRIVNVTSGAGSLAKRTDLTQTDLPLIPPYNCSKAALNMLGACDFVKYKDEKLKVFTYCPGYRVSNLSQKNKAEYGAEPVEGGASPMLPILNGEKDGEAGTYMNSEGGHWPW